MQRALSSILVAAVGLILVSCSNSGEPDSKTVTITGSGSSVAGFAFSQDVRPWSVAATGSPTTMKLKVYQILVSTNTNCSNPVSLIDHGATPVEINMIDRPVLFSGEPAAGTYPCLILKVSDTLKYKVNAAAVTAWPTACTNTTTEFQHDIYRTDNGGSVFKDLNFATITATGVKSAPSSDIVYLVGSTVPSAAITAGYNVNQTFTLLSALTVPGATTFYVDFNDGIENTGDGICTLEEGAGMGFR